MVIPYVDLIFVIAATSKNRLYMGARRHG